MFTNARMFTIYNCTNARFDCIRAVLDARPQIPTG